MEAEPIKGLVWNLYREHIRAFSHAAIKGEPSLEEMKSAYNSLLPEMTVKILAQEKAGMIVQFHHLDTFPARELAGILQIQEYLSNRYGGGKFKLNLYHRTNFLSTKNYQTEGPDIWKQFVKEDPRHQ